MNRSNWYNSRGDYHNQTQHNDYGSRQNSYTSSANLSYTRNRNVNNDQHRSNVYQSRYRYNRDPYTTTSTRSEDPSHNQSSSRRGKSSVKLKPQHENYTYSNLQSTSSFEDSNFIHPTRRDMPLLSPEEVKVWTLIEAIRSQDGITGDLILMRSERDSPVTILQNATQSVKNGVLSVVCGNGYGHFQLKLNGEVFAEGEFSGKQTAKNALCEVVLHKLEKTCFSVIKKNNYEEILAEDINKSKRNVPSSNTMEGSKAHLMMLKMGWGGKGLGINEQGAEKTVAETMTKNVTKEGLGGKNIMDEINNILKEFALSTKVTTLAFDSSFTKEERAQIHNLAARLNLKSRSERKGEDRRITIAKKIERWDLVKELLLSDCENDAYKLLIPTNFENMWSVQ